MARPAVPGPAARKLTYFDYVTLPDDGQRYEILDGQLAVTPAPTSTHQRVSQNLNFALESWVRPRKLGTVWQAPLDVILDEHTVLEPDIMFVAASRAEIVTKRGIEAAPDLVIEILSQSTAALDRGKKLHLYARHGVGRYWIVDPENETLEVFALRDGAYVAAGTHRGDDVAQVDVPPGFELQLAEVWSRD
jgi:Uma2 family endonuclease